MFDWDDENLPLPDSHLPIWERELQQSLENVCQLLALMLVRGDNAPLLQKDLGYHHSFPMDQFPRDFGRQPFFWNLTPNTQTHPDHQLTFATRFKISYCLACHQEALFKDAAEIEVVEATRANTTRLPHRRPRIHGTRACGQNNAVV